MRYIWHEINTFENGIIKWDNTSNVKGVNGYVNSNGLNKAYSLNNATDGGL